MSSINDAVFLFDNYVDYATVSAQNQVTEMPATNLQDPVRATVWRGLSTYTSNYVDITLDDVHLVNYFAFVDHNLTSAGSIDIKGWTDAINGSSLDVHFGFNPPVFRSAGASNSVYGTGLYGDGPYGEAPLNVVPVGNTLIVKSSPTTQLSKYWRITFTDSSLNYIQCSRIIMSAGFHPSTLNPNFGWTAKRTTRSDKEQSLGGQDWFTLRPSRLQLDLLYDEASDSEIADFMNWAQYLDETQPFFFALRPKDYTDISSIPSLMTQVYGTLQWNGTGMSFDRNRLSVTLTESL